MAILDAAQAMGDVVTLARTNPKHLVGAGEPAPTEQNPESSFGQLLINALGNVNDSQLTATRLSEQMITSPDSVNVEDVTIALAQANLALSMTKAIVDRAIAAYREIINIR
ncbi:MAG TPA: flagellar hook-basal body complex protein FliE [Spirochaetia bacterium]|nr:flagellar hook-basal body complex protein FliE [Spirochaetia bacterium]